MPHNPDLLVRFLAKLSKKGKGGVDLDLLREAFAAMGGWSIVDVCVPLEAFKSYDVRDLVTKQIPGCHGIRRDYDTSKGRELKTVYAGFRSLEDAVVGHARMAADFVTVSKIPSDAEVGRVYISNLEKPINAQYHITVPMGLMWIGTKGWRVTAPSGASVTMTSLASLWTFLYKHNVDAERALAAMGSDALEQAAMTKAERERVLAAREHLPEIAEVFRSITERRFKRVVEGLTEVYIHQAHGVVDLRNANDPRAYAAFAYSNLYGYDRATQKYFVEPDVRSRAAVHAEEDAESARQEFIFKNTTRISAIAKRKKMLPAIKVLSERDEGVAGYGGEIQFSFEDGSSFQLRNKTVWKRTAGGRHFAQFPTTFHQVVMSDGTQMPAPASEERMLDVFSNPETE